MIVVFFTAYLAEYQPANVAIIAVAVVLSSIFYIALGTLLGLLFQVCYGSFRHHHACYYCLFTWIIYYVVR